MADDKQVTITISAKNLTSEEFAKARTALAGISSSTKQADESSQHFLGTLGEMGHSFAARVAEGVLLRDAIRKVLDVVSQLPADLEDIGKRGAAVSDLARNFQYLSAQAGVSAKDMLAQLREGTAGALDDFTLMKLANKAMGDQLDASGDNMKVLAAGARELGKSVGQDTAQAFDVLTTAVSTGRTMTLAQYGIFVDTKKAVEDYAKSLHVSVGDLTSFQHQTALSNAAMEALRARLALAGPQAADFGEQLEGIKARLRNFLDQVDVGIAESPVLMAGLQAVGQALSTAFGGNQQAMVKSIVADANALGIVIVDAGIATTQVATVGVAAWSAVKTAVLGVETGIVGVVAGIATVNAKAYELLALHPKLTGVTQAEAAAAQTGADKWQAMTKSLAAETAEAAKGVVGHSALNHTIDQVAGALFTVRDRMEAATTAATKETAAHEALAKKVQAAAEVSKAMAAAQAELASVGQGLYDTVNAINPVVVRQIQHYLDLGASQNVVAKAYGLTALQVKAVADAMTIERSIEKTAISESEKEFANWEATVSKAADVVAKSVIDGFTEIQQAQRANADETAKLTQTSQDYQITKIKATAAQAILTFKGTAEQRRVFIALENQLADQQVAALKIDTTAIRDNSVASLQETADKAQATYQYMLDHHTEFTATVIEHYREIAQAAQDAADGTSAIWTKTFKSLAAGIPALIQQGFTGGGGVAGAAKAIGSSVGQHIGQGVTDELTQAAPKFMSGALGTMLGSALPVVGSLIGPLIGKLFSIGGPSQQELQGRQTEAQFEQQFGSFQAMMAAVGKAYEATGRSAQQAQADVKALMDAEKQGGAAVTAAINKINGAFTDQQQDAQDLQAAIQKYGFTLAELGPTLQKQQLDQQAQQLINDWRVLVQGGIDVGTVNDHMASTMQGYLDMARKTGQEVPVAMQPILQKMIDQGLLTDANGKKITDMKDLGVSFSETMTEGFQKVVDKLDELIQKIGGEIPAALKRMPTSVDVSVALNGKWNIPSVPGGSPVGFATEAFVRHPTFAIVGDAPGGEFVLKPSTIQGIVDRAAAAGAAGASTFDVSGLESRLDQQAAQLAGIQRSFATMPQSLARATRDALLQAR